MSKVLAAVLTAFLLSFILFGTACNLEDDAMPNLSKFQAFVMVLVGYSYGQLDEDTRHIEAQLKNEKDPQKRQQLKDLLRRRQQEDKNVNDFWNKIKDLDPDGQGC